jgi:penicillin amidase
LAKNLLKNLLLAFPVALLIAPLAADMYLRTYLPDYDETLTIPELKAPVTVKRNPYALPFIEAGNIDDLFFAWGYVNAQDRMFQMEFIKRVGQGRISEFAGEEALSKDIFLRAVGFAELAQRETDALPAQDRRVLQRFADGVNYYLDTHRKPLYFSLLGLKKENWRPCDSLLMAYMLNWSLAYNMKHELMYQRIADKIGPEATRKLLRLIPADTPVTVAGLDLNPLDLLAGMRLPVALLGCRSASNAWVLSPRKTGLSGPLLASDPHMKASKIPGDFYLVRVKAAEIDVAGGQVAGVPFVAVGYNRHVAWGVTNQGADVVDIYFESVDWERKTYLRNGKELPLTAKEATFAIKGKPPLRKTLYYAGRRPLLNEVFPDLEADISIDWAGFESEGHFSGFLALNRSRSHKEFDAAVKRIQMSPQNMVCADSAGTIAYRTIGTLLNRIPGSGNFPQSTVERAANWNAILDPELNPASLNPPEGFIASANNRVVRDFPFDMNGTFAPRFRYERIAQMLRAENANDVHTTMQMQNDTRSELALKMIPIMKRLIRTRKNARAEQALQQVAAWNGDMRPELPEPSVYNTWLIRFMYQTFKDELGEELAASYVGERYIVLERFLALLRDQSSFFDDTGTPEKETASDIATRAFMESLEILTDFTGSPDMAQWHWRKLHQIRFKHLLGKSKALRPFVNRGPYPMGGDGETNLRALFNQIVPPFTVGLAAGLRMVVGFDPQPRGHLVSITGQNEFFMSQHYDDMTGLWLRGKYFPVEGAEVRYTTVMRPG